MQYKYATEGLDYSDLASGRVFYSLPGHPAFPVRLASEIFQRCIAHRQAIYEDFTLCTLYDPCCGAAYHLSVLAYLHGEYLREVIGSDIDEKATALAKRNLSLLHMNGLNKRINELTEMFNEYNKESHRDALRSASVLRQRLTTLLQKHLLETRVFQASAMDGKEILNNIKAKSVDIVFTDIPYGRHSYWRDTDLNRVSNPLNSLLETLLGVISPSSIVAIASDKQQRALHESYQRLEQFQVGKRRVTILKPINNRDSNEPVKAS